MSPQPDWALRPALPEDAPAIEALTRAAYSKWIPFIGREAMPMKTHYGEVIGRHPVDVIERDGEVIAVIHMERRPDHLYVDNVAIAEDEQGKGFARILLNRAEALARQSGLKALRLITNKAFASNLALYRHLGYEAEAEVPFRLGGTAVCFVKTLMQP